MDLNKYETLKERFLKYVKIETRSDEKNESIPSTLTQLEFAKMLVKELEEKKLDVDDDVKKD